MCIFGGGGGKAAKAAAQQQEKQAEQQTQLMMQQAEETRAEQERRTAAIAAGKGYIDEAFSAFDDSYFDKLSDSYLSYARPQLDDQYEEARKNITYALARKGTLNSSIAGDQYSKLDKQYATNLTGVMGTGADYANQVRRDVEANRNDATNQLISTGDADATRAASLSAAKTLMLPPSFSPLGALFTNISALAAQNKLASDTAPVSYGSSVGTRLFGSGASPSYVVR